MEKKLGMLLVFKMYVNGKKVSEQVFPCYPDDVYDLMNDIVGDEIASNPEVPQKFVIDLKDHGQVDVEAEDNE